VTDSDVENYKQIKSDLDELRNLVEKSELWVYKEKKGDDSRKKKKSGGGSKTEVREVIRFFKGGYQFVSEGEYQVLC